MKNLVQWLVIVGLTLGGFAFADGTDPTDPDTGFTMPTTGYIHT